MEIQILRKIKHQNVIKLFEVYEDETHVHLVMEYLMGGELFNHIKNAGTFNEGDAIKIMKSLLSALAHIHQMGIIHRDLKPENLIMANKYNMSRIKIADFGLATIMVKGQKETLRCGSPGYVAPEILNNCEYDTKVDIFSAGVILYTLLSGLSPFYGISYQEILSKNRKCLIEYPEQHWSFVSDMSKDLLHKMVEIDPVKRYSADQCLDHYWLSDDSLNSVNCSAQSCVIENMKKSYIEY